MIDAIDGARSYVIVDSANLAGLPPIRRYFGPLQNGTAARDGGLTGPGHAIRDSVGIGKIEVDSRNLFRDSHSLRLASYN